MVAAVRPLTKKEIASAFALWKDGLVLSSQEDLDEYTDICLSCSSIICPDDIDEDRATVNFCHQSVKDFLLDGHDRTVWYHTPRDHANLALFQVCWNYLVGKDFSRGNLIVRYETRDGTEHLVKETFSYLGYISPKYAFLRYACEE